MPQLKAIAQRNWVKGVVATQDKWAQAPHSVPRLSNLLLSDRGGLTTCNGSQEIYLLSGSLQAGSGPWTELFLFQPVNVQRYYIGIKKDYSTHIGAPTGLAVVDGGAGGGLANAIYKYEVTALDGAGGETTVSNEASFANPGAHKANLSWVAVANALSYNVYRTAAGGGAGTEVFIANVAAPTVTFVDDGSITPSTVTPPTADTTQTSPFFKLPNTLGATLPISYNNSNIVATFPADPIVPNDGTPGGSPPPNLPPGSGGSGGAPPSPSGGNAGNISPLPQIIQFANKAVLALGNGFAPQLFTDPSTVAAIGNTFTATYPDWQATTTYNQGNTIKPTANNAGNFVFTAAQEGTSAGAAPTFPQTQGQTVADGKVIWKNTGATTTSPAPRGAAHAEVYAGSLWLANTSPTTTSDQLDGPTVLRMSDLNNPNSWNPLNTAFVGRDDGDQITAIKSFTIAAEGIAPTGSLIVFKYFSTFQVIGVFGAPDFAIQAVKTDMGCIASRSVAFLPGFGLARLTHLGVAIFDGVNDRLISEEIRPYLFSQLNLGSDIAALDQNFAYFSKGAQCANPPMYMLAIPLTTNMASGLVGSSVTFLVGGGGSFGNLIASFYKITKVVNSAISATNPTGEVAISQEFTIPANSPGQNGRVQIIIPTDPTASSFRVYSGTTGPGSENTFIAGVASGTTILTLPTQFNNIGSPGLGSGSLTRILCYDMVLKAWTVIDLPFQISVLKQVRAVGIQPITITGGFSDASVRRLQANDLTFDGSAVIWSMRSAEVFGKSAAERVYFRRVIIRGTTTQASLVVNCSINLDGADGTIGPTIVYQQGSVAGTFDFLATIDIGSSNYTSHITLSGTGNVEIDSLDWDAYPMSTGVPPAL